jgi:hypothetical protein
MFRNLKTLSLVTQLLLLRSKLKKLKLQILFGNISNVSTLLRELYLLNKKLKLCKEPTMKQEPTQLTALMPNMQVMLNVLLNKSIVLMNNFLTMLNVLKMQEIQ